jgi:hypothetical protein
MTIDAAATAVQPGPTTAKIAYQHEDKHHVLVNVGTIEWARYPLTLNNVDVQINDLREAPEFKPILDKNGFAKLEGLEPLPAGLKGGDAKIRDEVYASVTEILKREYAVAVRSGSSCALVDTNDYESSGLVVLTSTSSLTLSATPLSSEFWMSLPMLIL